MLKTKTKIVVILGAGRSGTSLLMNITHGLGVRVSDNLISANHTNVKGAWEDKEILEICRELLRYFTRNALHLSYLPMPNGWLTDQYTLNQIDKLTQIVDSRINESEGVWGFKEPVTAKLLPMWKIIFDALDLEPKYLLALRNPRSVVKSFNTAYDQPELTAELIWLSRYLDSIKHTGGEFLVTDYDQWFANPIIQAKEILDYIDIPTRHTESELQSLLEAIVENNLNQSSVELPKLNHPQTDVLYQKLLGYQHNQTQLAELMGLVTSGSAILDENNVSVEAIDFIGEHLRQAKQAISDKNIKLDLIRDRDKLKAQKNSELRDKNDELRGKNNELRGKNDELRGKNDELRNKNNGLRDKNNGLRDKNSGLRDKNSGLRDTSQRLRERVKQRDEKYKMLQNSTSLKLGKIIVTAFAKPGMNTLLLPLRIIKLTTRRFFK